MSSHSSIKPVKPAARKSAVKPAARKPRSGRPAAASPDARSGVIAPEVRRSFIAEAAYFKAEKRSFAEGGDLNDWIEAEAEIDALLNAPGAS